jgi:hypothetical protein
MFIKMSYTSDNGVVYPECCVVIGSIIFSRDYTMICTNYFANQSDYESDALPITQPLYTNDGSYFDLAGGVVNNAYNYLLTLPEFSEGTLN